MTSLFEIPFIFLLGFIWGCFCHMIVKSRSRRVLGTLMVDCSDPDGKKGYITFNENEMRSIPKRGYVELKVREFSRKKNNDLDEY